MHKGEDSFVVVNEEICIGCRYCHMACPYGAPQFDAAKGPHDQMRWLPRAGGGGAKTHLR